MTTTSNTLTISKAGYTSVQILLVGRQPVAHDIDKKLIMIDVPKQTPPYTLIVDLARTHEVITFAGYLLDEVGSGMWTKRNNLRNMMLTTGDIYVVWDTNDPQQTTTGYCGDILKYTIMENPEGMGDSEEPKAFGITIQFVVGRTKG